MTMIVNDRQRIFYRFEGEKGAFLLLHHDLFGSHRDWYEEGYVEALVGDFRLIIPDARGHGRSDHPLDPARYRLEDFCGDVVAIMDDLDIRNLHFFGYGLGALVGFDLLRRHPERLRITMLGGEAPFVTPPLIAEWEALAGQIRAEGRLAALRRLHGEARLVSLPDASEGEGEQQAALALLAALAATPPEEGEQRISFNSPLALYTGEHDPALGRIQEGRKRIHRARFVSLAGQDHAGLFRQREALLEEVLRLLHSGRNKGESGEGAEESRRSDRRAAGGPSGGGQGSRRRSESPPAAPPNAEAPAPARTPAPPSAQAPPQQAALHPARQQAPAPAPSAERREEPEAHAGGTPPSAATEPARIPGEPEPSEPDFPPTQDGAEPPEAHGTEALPQDVSAPGRPESPPRAAEGAATPMAGETREEGAEAGREQAGQQQAEQQQAGGAATAHQAVERKTEKGESPDTGPAPGGTPRD